MSAPQRDDHGPLPTAAIFDDAVYCAEALQLPADQTEDSVDRELALLAEERDSIDKLYICAFPYLKRPSSEQRAHASYEIATTARASVANGRATGPTSGYFTYRNHSTVFQLKSFSLKVGALRLVFIFKPQPTEKARRPPWLVQQESPDMEAGAVEPN
ncbi:hypothetical protein SNOG_00250 [Parastagonospora nodorum SN15]|uniref:Uncharacterized protein n=1 Tax=Phaeosphaeria nodorum (strain SN15 / ATCC MYA-4574 / FGSC 10173) TaxID=321614 RepID=Q0V6W4_PHANO|nr:hypothetical protein SNOG_00250 [Parastagonospora nodorum SN15]EAT91745.2 hypothetical protein SNOG_00250 [Parastagonospora nodorum SN15]